MPALDLKTQLSDLIKLQSIDTEIYAFNREKTVKPEEIKAIELKFEEKKKGLADLEKNLLDLQKQRKDKEGELAVKEGAVKKLQVQLYSLKTNKEYQVMMHQIQDSKADASIIEDKILQLFEATDKISKDTDKEKNLLKEEEKAFFAQKQQVEARIKEIDGCLLQLHDRRNQMLPLIDPKILSQYERILANRDGLAIAGVKDNSCLGCNMLVPAQVINLIQMYDHIITCEMCNRILYIPTDESS